MRYFWKKCCLQSTYLLIDTRMSAGGALDYLGFKSRDRQAVESLHAVMAAMVP